MAKRDHRKDDFELVVKLQGAPEDLRTIPAHSEDVDVPHRFIIAGDKELSQETAWRSEGEDNMAETEVKVDLARNPEPRNGIVTGTSFDNATYSCNKSERRTQQRVSLTIGNILPIVLVALLAILIFAGLVAVLALAPVNYEAVSKLEQSKVSQDSYQATVSGFEELFRNMTEQISSLKSTVSRLSERVEVLSQQLNQTNSELSGQIANIEVKIANQRDGLTEVRDELGSGLNNSLLRLDGLESDQMDSDLRLSALEVNVSSLSVELESDIASLRATISSPVDVFESCQSGMLNETLSFSSNDSGAFYTVSTEAMDISDTNETFITNVRCQIHTSDASHDFILSSHMTVHANSLGCTCTAVPPLSSNGTHISEEELRITITCSTLFTSCSRRQQLFSSN